MQQNKHHEDLRSVGRISTTPVSQNLNLLRNKKNNNLSSYAHPVNAKLQQDLNAKEEV